MMSGLPTKLISALIIICMMCMTDVDADKCYLDMEELCFSNDLPCWNSYPGEPDTLGNHFFLYSQDGFEEIMWNDVSSLGVFNVSRKTVVISHGFRSSYLDAYIEGIRIAFMREYDVNVIMVDWEEAADGLVEYFQCRVDTRLVGRQLGILLKQLHDHQNLNYDDVHMVGHSLGAHLVGFAGAYLEGQIGRITGLDPAKPGFKPYTDKPDCVLDKSDAQFVDIIHSDGLFGVLGLKQATGHLDFYPNKGDLSQVDCMFKPVGCSHMRAIEFFIASLDQLGHPSDDCDYKTRSCDWWKSCPNGGCPKMGIEASPGSQPKSYCLNTECYTPME